MTAAHPPTPMHAAAARGEVALQRCAACGTLLYPSREACCRCQSDRLVWETAAAVPGEVLARTRLYHSYEARFRPDLPLGLGLVRLAGGPVALCFLPDDPAPGASVQVRARLDATGHPVLEAT